MASTADSETRQQVLGPDINIPAYTYLQHHQATLGRGVYTIIAQHLSPETVLICIFIQKLFRDGDNLLAEFLPFRQTDHLQPPLLPGRPEIEQWLGWLGWAGPCGDVYCVYESSDKCIRWPGVLLQTLG